MKTIVTKRHKRLIELLIEERKSRQIGQTGLAYALRKGQAWISKIERGGRRVDVIEFLDLADAIGGVNHKRLHSPVNGSRLKRELQVGD